MYRRLCEFHLRHHLFRKAEQFCRLKKDKKLEEGSLVEVSYCRLKLISQSQTRKKLFEALIHYLQVKLHVLRTLNHTGCRIMPR